jgi:hypothetical protein
MILASVALSVSAAELDKPMRVTICPRLVLGMQDKDRTAFVRRVDDLFDRRRGDWTYVSENISHFKFYSTPLVWMAKRNPELLNRTVKRIAAMDMGIAVEVGIRHGHAQTERAILDPITKAGGRVLFPVQRPYRWASLGQAVSRERDEMPARGKEAWAHAGSGNHSVVV